MIPMLNVSYRKVGGLRFVRVGRLQLSFCVVKRKHPDAELYDRFCAWARKQPRTHRAPRIIDDVQYYREYEGGSTVVVYRDR
jgi:hypothetical protein